jgi:clan AA aspartic protease (TIGR02281 family)
MNNSNLRKAWPVYNGLTVRLAAVAYGAFAALMILAPIPSAKADTLNGPNDPHWLEWRPADQSAFDKVFNDTLANAKANLATHINKGSDDIWNWGDSKTLNEVDVKENGQDRMLCYFPGSDLKYGRCWGNHGVIMDTVDASQQPPHYVAMAKNWAEVQSLPLVAKLSPTAPVPAPAPAPTAPVPALAVIPNVVPFSFNADGGMSVAAMVGGVPTIMTVDTGASLSVVPTAVADQLIASGQATEDKPYEFKMADGSPRKERIIVVKTMTVGTQTRTNVPFAVSPDGGMSLLGMPVLGSFGRFSVDIAKLQLTLG